VFCCWVVLPAPIFFHSVAWLPLSHEERSYRLCVHPPRDEVAFLSVLLGLASPHCSKQPWALDILIDEASFSPTKVAPGVDLLLPYCHQSPVARIGSS
jgi:hypothetical protein